MGRRQGGKGTGLGLALVRQIVQLSKGRLGVDSEYGKGSVFWFELPYRLLPRDHDRGGAGIALTRQPNADMDEYVELETTRVALERRITAEQLLVSSTDEPPYLIPTAIPETNPPLAPAAPLPSVASTTAESSSSPEAVISGIPEEDHTGPLDVLVVDDDKLTRMMMSRMIQRLGHRVETAENGQIAYDKIESAWRSGPGAKPVDVVFLDK